MSYVTSIVRAMALPANLRSQVHVNLYREPSSSVGVWKLGVCLYGGVRSQLVRPDDNEFGRTSWPHRYRRPVADALGIGCVPLKGDSDLDGVLARPSDAYESTVGSYRVFFFRDHAERRG
jgi:hypothetical protein